MSNRGRVRGTLEQAPKPVWREPHAWWVNVDTGAATEPQPCRRDRQMPSLGASQPPPTAAASAPPTLAPPAPAVTPPPIRRERGGLALDGVERLTVRDPSHRSWRDCISRYAGIDLGPGREEAHLSALQAQVGASIGGAFPIAVLNLKGGVGKTVVVETLGSTFASLRGDRVIAVDIDSGDLSDRHGRRNALTMADLIRDRTVARYDDVRAHTYMNSAGLEVLGPPDYAKSRWSVTRQDFVKAYSILRSYYSLVLVDCPKTLKSDLMEAVLREARALVIVTSTSIDAVQKTRTTLEWLSNNGYRGLIASTVCAVNQVDGAKPTPLVVKELEQLSTQVGASVSLPFDRHVHQGKEIGLDRVSRQTRRAYLELAGELARMFPRR
ncbi:MinD/ParA family ATP-binding protein [Mycobacterium vicinigordonae]|uniref:MinD/ParA family protein n=1 Tax=Mycobacterium vicinigordonae TaxID=1719132 RepID=A0A7D6E7M4_9MYCO|nr:MinD/ParA family protein [Mycobacterium vicinigordonae]QLL09062.1 MinD/ParA family protein [Mycobacterium vicinigordonae]